MAIKYQPWMTSAYEIDRGNNGFVTVFEDADANLFFNALIDDGMLNKLE